MIVINVTNRIKGKIMPTNFESMDIEQLMAEADELIRQMDSDAIQDIKAEHRLEVERHAQHLKKIKSEVQGRIRKDTPSAMGSGAEGMHEAIQEIARAMVGLKKYLSGDRPGAVE
jgi:hypothetical protein